MESDDAGMMALALQLNFVLNVFVILFGAHFDRHLLPCSLLRRLVASRHSREHTPTPHCSHPLQAAGSDPDRTRRDLCLGGRSLRMNRKLRELPSPMWSDSDARGMLSKRLSTPLKWKRRTSTIAEPFWTTSSFEMSEVSSTVCQSGGSPVKPVRDSTNAFLPVGELMSTAV